MNRQPDNRFQQKHALWTKDFMFLLACSFLFTIGVGVLVLFPLLVLDIGGGQSEIGFLMGGMSLSAVIARPWISGLVDRMGRKKSMMAGSLLAAAVSIVHLFFIDAIGTVFPVLVLLRLLIGIGYALGFVAFLTMAADLAAGPRLNEGIGYFGIMPMLGMAIGPAIGELFMNRWGFNAMFLLGAFFFIACFLMVLPVKEAFSPVAAGGALKKFLRTLRIPVVCQMGFICLCFGLAYAAHGSFVAPFAKAGGLTVSAYFVSYSGAAVLVRLTGSRLARRFGERRVMMVALLVAGAGFAGLTRVNATWQLMVIGCTAGAGHGLLFPSLISLAIRPVAADERGKVTGILSGGFDGGMFVGAMVMGQIGEYFGFRMIFAAAAFILFFGFVAFLKIIRSQAHAGR
jgi:MFS family permease